MISLAISFLIALLLFGKTISHKKFPFKKVYFMIFLIIALFGISSFYLFSQTKGIKQLKLWKDPVAYAGARFIYWQAAYDNFLKNPLAGTGLDTFGEALTKYGNIGKAAHTRYAHNFFIQMLSDAGVFGFLTSIVLIISILWQAARRASETRNFLYVAIFTGLLSSTFLAMIDFDWHVPTVFLFFWTFASISTRYD
jgi:O-antigen ligase